MTVRTHERRVQWSPITYAAHCRLYSGKTVTRRTSEPDARSSTLSQLAAPLATTDLSSKDILSLVRDKTGKLKVDHG